MRNLDKQKREFSREPLPRIGDKKPTARADRTFADKIILVDKSTREQVAIRFDNKISFHFDINSFGQK